MQKQEATFSTDALLEPLLAAREGAELDARLARLVGEHAEPIARAVIRRKLRTGAGDAAAAEDLYGDVLVQLLARLAELRRDPAARAIQDFRGYVAVTAYRACADYLREKYPQRHSLRNKLRYLLTHQPGLALWESGDGEKLCGFSHWQGRDRASFETRDDGRTASPSSSSNGRVRRLREDPHAFAEAALPRASAHGVELSEVLTALFNWTAAPVELDDVVAATAELLGVKDQTPRDESDDEESASENLFVDPRASVADEVTQRVFLERLWAEVEELPPRQRAALLLNLRDAQGGSAVELFIITGVATPSRLARAVDLTPERFAEIWRGLPLDDATIAGLLGATRQQVINLRKCARERLGRRMKAIGF